MYTGIVKGAYPVVLIERRQGLHTLHIELPEELLEGIETGASVAVDGVCLTVTQFDNRQLVFDVMQETLDLTTLGQLKQGGRVNIERSAKQGAEVGGHPVSGHVDGTVEVVSVETPDNNCLVHYRIDTKHFKYIFKKGFIALNGCSLTIADVNKSDATFTVCYIPETLRMTTHGEKLLGERVNFEIDRQTQVIVETVERLLSENPQILSSQ